MPRLSVVTSTASRKVIAAECLLAIVTRHTTERVGRGVMIERLRRGYLKPLSDTTSYTMAIITTQARVSVVLRMTETHAESQRCLARADATPHFMTNATRRNVPIP